MSGIVAELLVDTDVFVDHLRGARPLRPARDSLHYSVVTRCELFAGSSAQEEIVGTLLSPFRELPVDRDVAETAGRIRREIGIRTPDALIAGTALVNGLALVTRNRRDFERVPKLRLRAPR
jgi:predicted nucleic acid-binding protein